MKNWEKTRIQGLYRHKNGNYYSRTFIGSREEWKSHRTKVFSIAEARHQKQKKSIQQRRSTAQSVDTGKVTFGQAVQLYLDALLVDTEKKESTKTYQREIINVLKKGFDPDKPIKRITPTECQQWASTRKGSATRFNGCVGVLRAILQLGVDSGAMVVNPAQAIKRRSVRSEIPELPTKDQFNDVLKAMRSAGARFSKPCADFVEGLACTGLRKKEANRLRWRDVDLTAGVLRVLNIGEGTKNREPRIVPMNPDARDFFIKLDANAASTERDALVFQVKEAQKALTRACKIAGAPRITHHDLRHLFCTSCIESGVDILTISKWLGHKDGGALLMRVYGHLRDDHSMEAAKRVRITTTRPVADEPPTPGPASGQAPQ